MGKVSVELTAITNGLDAALDSSARKVDQLANHFGKVGEATAANTTSMGRFAESWGNLDSKIGPVITKIGLTGAAMSATVMAGVKGAAEWAHGITETAEMLGITDMKSEAFTRSLAKVGIEADAATPAIIGMNKAVRDAMTGKNADAATALQKLGLDPKVLRGDGKDSIDTLVAITKALKGVKDSQTRMDLANDLGLSGRMMKILKADLDKDMANGPKSATWIDPQQMKDLEAAKISFRDLGATISGTWRVVWADVAPVVTALNTWLTGMAKSVAEFAKAHPDLIKTLGSFALYGGTALTAVMALYKGINLLVGGMNLLSKIGVGGKALLGLTGSATQAAAGAAQAAAGAGGSFLTPAAASQAVGAMSGAAGAMVPIITTVLTAAAVVAAIAGIVYIIKKGIDINGEINKGEKANATTNSNIEAWNKNHPDQKLRDPGIWGSGGSKSAAEDWAKPMAGIEDVYRREHEKAARMGAAYDPEGDALTAARAKADAQRAADAQAAGWERNRGGDVTAAANTAGPAASSGFAMANDSGQGQQVVNLLQQSVKWLQDIATGGSSMGPRMFGPAMLAARVG